MNKLRFLYIIAIFTIVLVACKKTEVKKDDPKVDPPTMTAQEYLSDTTWKITALTADGVGDVWNNPFFVKPCNKDNTYYFKLTNILTSYDTPSKCNATDPDSTSGPYKLIENNKRMFLDLTVGTIQIQDTTDVVVIDKTTLKLNFNYSGFPGVITFGH
ncbi:MAG: lipocalin family protein [bacterium]|nr:lipocalin family protein [bacterium]